MQIKVLDENGVEEWRGSLSAFEKDNRDALDCENIRKELLKGNKFKIGGGAAPFYTVQACKEPKALGE